MQCPICNSKFQLDNFVAHVHDCYYYDCKSKGFKSNCNCNQCSLPKEVYAIPSDQKRKQAKLELVLDNSNSCFDSVPTPILQHIFSYLTDFDCFVVNLVCKHWNTLISRNQSTEFYQLILHFCETGSLSVLKWLRYQTSLYKPIPMSNYFVAMKLATKNGHFEVMKWLKENGCSSFDDMAAASFGDLDICKWMYRNGCSFDSRCAAKAAEKGNLPLLQWFQEIGLVGGLAMSQAASEGRLDIVKWLKDNGIHWDKQTCAAARSGNLKMLQWIRELGCPWNVDVCSSAASNGHLEVLKWARELNCPWDSSTTLNAAHKGHIEILKWSVEQGCELHHLAFKFAAEFGNVEILDYLKNKGLEMVPEAYNSAAQYGHIQVLEWLLENGVQKSDTACDCASSYGQMKALQWLHKNGFSWSASTIARAAEYPDIFKWLLNNGCPRNTTAIERIVAYNNPKLLKWALKRGFEANAISELESTANSLECLKLLKQWNYELSAPVWENAIYSGSIRVLSWLLKNGCPIDQKSCDECTDEEVKEWLITHKLRIRK